MEQSKAEIVAGGLTLAVAAGFLIYATQAAGLRGGGSASTDYVASFRSADGIAAGTDVRLAGVRIGSVRALSLNPETYRADVTLAVDAAVEIPEDSSIAISSEGLLGDNFVEIVPGGSPFALPPGGDFQDTQGAVSLLGLLAKFVAASTAE